MPQTHNTISPLRRSVAKNTIAQLAGRLVSSLSTLAITLYVARSLGSSGYGDFVKITTFVSFFYLLVDFGLNAIYIQRSENESEHTAFNELVILRIVLSCMLISAAYGIVYVLPHHSANGYTDIVRLGIVLMLPTIFFQAMITTSNGLFQKIFRYEWSTVAVVSGSAVSLIAVWVLTGGIVQPTVILSLVPLILGSAITAFTGIWFVMHIKNRESIQRDLRSYREFVYSAVPLGLTLIFNVIYFHIDSVVLTVFRPTQEVGVYGLAYKVFELALVFPTFFMNAVYPILVKKAQNSKFEIRDFIIKLTGFLFLVSCGISLVLWFCAPLLVIIKQDFVFSISALRVLALGLPFFFLSSLMMWVLITLKKQLILVYIYGCSMVINIALNYMFVPNGGYIFAAWITVLCEGLVLLGSGAAVYRELTKGNI